MRAPLRLSLLALVGVLIVGGALAIALTSSSEDRQSPRGLQSHDSTTGFDGALLPSTQAPHDFTLTNQHGRRVSLSDYRGRVVILTFLASSTASANASRLMAQQIRGALEELRAQTSKAAPSTLAVSVDPRADTPNRVRAFLRRVSLSGRVEYLTGTPAQLREVWGTYEIVPPRGPRDRGPNRSAYVLLIDRRGSQRVRFYVEQLTPEGLAHDIRRLEAG